MKIPYLETSAKTADNIDEVFLKISKIIETNSQ
jgi:GTPase SAR1 family protein